MGTTRSLIAVIALVAVCAAAIAKPPSFVKAERVGMSTERLNRITEMSQRYVDEGKLAGVITMVARKGKLVHFEVVGNKGADDPRPLQKDDLFRIYSMSKPITAAAAMQLYEQGKFHLSDPVHEFVPELADLTVLDADGKRVGLTSPMTMHHLLTHTAGFSYGFNPDGDPVDKAYSEANLWGAKDLDAFASVIAKLPLKFQPGNQWHYSIAVDVTGLVIERISGLTFDEYLRRNIFEPLGMNDTFFEVPADKADRFLPNHYWDRENKKLGTIVQEGTEAMSDYQKVSLYSGGGGLVSTAMDYMRFSEAMRNGGELNGVRILSDKTVRYMSKNHLPASISSGGTGESPLIGQSQRGFGFGLGFGVVTDAVNAGVMGSDGEFNWGGAAGTVFWIDPVEEIVVVGMIQLMGSPWPLRSDLKVATYQAVIESYE
jgi:CubicO group peptidase (beta-lactamase class C family)|tara:strand:- start:3413 stop:4702 length:1290 start_codon:yes stop_codon:yes gene_type:complete